eukprot:gene8373-17264_t
MIAIDMSVLLENRDITFKIMEWLHPLLKFPIIRTSKACCIAMKHFGTELKSSKKLYCSGSVHFIKWALDEGCPFSTRTTQLCFLLSQKGSLELLMWARSRDPPYEWDSSVFSEAVSGGHLDILKWLISQNPPCPWDKVSCDRAAFSGNLLILNWLRSHSPPCPWSSETCSEAAKGGHLEVLKWLRSQDPPCPWSSETCSEAAKGGHLE